jgi:DNA-binding NtrC family response regulator
MNENKKSGHILFIEDDENIIEAYECVLEDTDIEYKIVTNGKDALKELNNNPNFDAIFLDQRIIGKYSGTDLLREFMKIEKAKLIPIVFCSAQWPAFTMKEFIFESPVVNYFSKPFKRQAFIDIMNRVINRENLGEIRREVIKQIIQHKDLEKLHVVSDFEEFVYFD